MKHKIVLALLVLTVLFSCESDDSTNNNNETTSVNVATNRQATGSSANDLLSDNAFKSLIVEIVYVDGFEPTDDGINNFVSFLESRINKPDGITIEKRSIDSQGQDVYSVEDIAQIERENRKYYNTENEIAVWAYFSDGSSDADSEEDNTVVLGAAYWNTSFVIFEETVQDLSGGAFQPDTWFLEATVINHEFGHIFGLTDLGSPLQSDHEDEDHPNHCDVESCLMYWSTESSVRVSNMTNMNTVPELDSQCIADLQANGGK
ncbi:membrane metalloprotease [Neotamlana laminarinivorans]|uniref:Membrane metalloprotease n=1 Tax=Neotamlana laminarinivorans TaxID=2883124 RepID=A0A9X1I160_9FLAO|nr:membrane metalloprotease [Tamlana laminarinivorans]MCB4798663.1 membrane metalloprotease [Tamlana laminarinivorans]